MFQIILEISLQPHLFSAATHIQVVLNFCIQNRVQHHPPLHLKRAKEKNITTKSTQSHIINIYIL